MSAHGSWANLFFEACLEPADAEVQQARLHAWACATNATIAAHGAADVEPSQYQGFAYEMSRRRPRPEDDDDLDVSQTQLHGPTDAGRGQPPAAAVVVMSDADTSVCALAYFAEAVGVAGSHFALPPLWPMVMAAAARQYFEEAAYFDKVFERFSGRLTEIDLRNLHYSSMLTPGAVAHGACAALRVLRTAGDVNALAWQQMPLLEELHGSCALKTVLPYLLPNLRRLSGFQLDCAPLLLVPQSAVVLPFEALSVIISNAAELTAVLDAAPNITKLELAADQVPSSDVVDALRKHPAAARLRHLVVNPTLRGRAPSPRRLTGFVNLETYSCFDIPGDLSSVVNSCPTLRHFEAICVHPCYFTDLSFLSRIVTLALARGAASSYWDELFRVTDWSTMPNVVALRHLSIDFGSHSAGAAAHFVHPLLETFDIRCSGRAPISVFKVLCRHRPQLRVLRYSGTCPKHLLDVLLSRCGGELRKLNLAVSIDAAREGWDTVAAHCPKLVELYCNLRCGRDGSEVVGLLSRCRRLERLSFVGPEELDDADFDELQNALRPLTVRRKLALQAWNPLATDSTHYDFMSDGMDRNDRDFELWRQMNLR